MTSSPLATYTLPQHLSRPDQYSSHQCLPFALMTCIKEPFAKSATMVGLALRCIAGLARSESLCKSYFLPLL